jgi:DNA-directed RNA polymerase specialized sigma24 family protein
MTAESRVRSSQEEALLIGQVLEGRQDLFCDLLRPHLPVLSRVVRAKMRNDPEAEDVVQQIVLKVFASLDTPGWGGTGSDDGLRRCRSRPTAQAYARRSGKPCNSTQLDGQDRSRQS